MKRYSVLFAVSVLSLVAFHCSAQGTAFTYQGRLNIGGSPANGNYDFRFTVWNAESGPSLVSGTVGTNALAVSNGLFTLTLDFGTGVFTGADRWLEINVRTNGGGAFDTLGPRQKLTATPYAVTAGNVASGGLLAGNYTNAVTFSNPANSFTGNGGGLTNVNAATVGGVGSNGFWRTTGNAGTTPGANFLGTTDNQAFEIQVDGRRALRIEPHATSAPSLAGGFLQNSVAGFHGAAIAGGGTSGSPNYALGNYAFIGAGHGGQAADYSAVVAGAYNVSPGVFSFLGSGLLNTNAADYSVIGGGTNHFIAPGANNAFIGGGALNKITGPGGVVGGGGNNAVNNFNGVISGGANNIVDENAAAIGGGSENHASGDHSTISGGQGNVAGISTPDATIGGGFENRINFSSAATIGGGFHNISGGDYATIGGGSDNASSGVASTVPGGFGNSAAGNFSFAAGNRAKANHQGSFVWADSQFADFASTANDQFLIRASGGVGIGTSTPVRALDVRDGTGTLGQGGRIHVGGTGANGDPKLINFGDGDFVHIGENGSDDILEFKATRFFFTGGSVTLETNAGLGTEDSARLLNFGINDGPVNRFSGGYESARQGGFLRTDTRPGQPLFGFFGRPAGITADVNQLGSITSDGAVRFEIGVGQKFSLGGNGDFEIDAPGVVAGRFVVTDAGNVGIGVPVPSFRLDVQASQAVGRFTTTSSGSGSVVELRNTMASAGTLGAINFSNSGSTPGQIAYILGNVMTFRTAGVNHMSLDSVGNLVTSGTVNGSSDRNVKAGFERVNTKAILDRVVALAITRWHYTNDSATPHIGPVAQDFHAAFDVGTDDKHIATVDADGVALAAIQGLNQKLCEELKRRDSENAELRREMADLKKLVQQIAQQGIAKTSE